MFQFPGSCPVAVLGGAGATAGGMLRWETRSSLKDALWKAGQQKVIERRQEGELKAYKGLNVHRCMLLCFLLFFKLPCFLFLIGDEGRPPEGHHEGPPKFTLSNKQQEVV